MKKLLASLLIAAQALWAPLALAADDAPVSMYAHATNFGAGADADAVPPSAYVHITNFGGGAGGAFMFNDGSNGTSAAFGNLVTVATAASARTSLGLGTGNSPTFTGLTLSGMTQGSVLFAGSGGVITQNNSAINWTDSTKVLTVNANASGLLPTPTTFTIAKFAGMDTGNARINIDAFGGFPALDMYRANGTAASPSAVLATNPIGSFSGGGYGATGYFSSKAAIVPIASENWTDTAQGTYFSIFTTNTGTTTRPEAARIQPSGGVSLGAAAVGTDPGVGSLVASGTLQGLTVITTQSGTTYTLAATDCGTVVRFTSGSAITLTTLNSLPVGCSVAIEQAGAGQITLANGSGATSHSAHSYTKTFGQYAIIGLVVDTNAGGTAANFIISGDGA